MKKIWAFVLLIVILISSFTQVSFAHNAVFLEALIDENTFTYYGGVIQDKASFFNAESKHKEAKLGDFSDLISNTTSFSVDTHSKNTTNGQSPMPFTFPAVEAKINGKKNDATKWDINRAYKIRDTLIPQLNDALLVINDGEPFETTEELLDATEELLSLSYPSGSDEITINRGGKSYTFTYRMEKGYKSGDFPELNSGNSVYSGDAEYITWHMLAYQACYSLKEHGVNLAYSSELNKPSALEQKVVEVLENTLNGLKNMLGLYDLNDLIYNAGVRGSAMYSEGIMSRGWMEVATWFHLIFQVIAWGLIICAILKMLLQRNIATINPSVRASLIEGIKDLLVTGFLLANTLFLMRIVFRLNFTLVNVFASTGYDVSSLSGVNNYSNLLSGILLQFFYFGIEIYLNFTYIIRSLMLAMLIGLAPLFIVSLSFGSRYKGLFDSWLKEVIANVFLQSFHAFIITFFLSIHMSSRGIEAMIVLYALVPLSRFFKEMIMGNSASVASQIGQTATSSMAGVVKGGVGPRGMGSSSTKTNDVNNEKGTENVSNGNAYNGKSNDIASNKVSENSSKLGSSQNKAYEKLSHSKEETMNAFNNRMRDPRLAEETQEEALGKKYVENQGKSSFREQVETLKGSTTGKVLSGSMNAVKATAQIGAGAGMALAFGAVDSNMAKIGGNMITSGVGTATKVTAGAVAGVGAMGKKVQEHFSPTELKKEEEAFLGARLMATGDIEKMSDKNVMGQHGLVDARTDNHGFTTLTYDKNYLPEEDKSNVERIESAYRAGHTEFLKEQGVEKVGINGQGGVAVTYNPIGTQKLGFKSMNAVGSRFSEIKESEHPWKTHKSFNVGEPSLSPVPPNYQKPTQAGHTSGGSNNRSSNVGGSQNVGGARNNVVTTPQHVSNLGEGSAGAGSAVPLRTNKNLTNTNSHHESNRNMPQHSNPSQEVSGISNVGGRQMPVSSNQSAINSSAKTLTENHHSTEENHMPTQTVDYGMNSRKNESKKQTYKPNHSNENHGMDEEAKLIEEIITGGEE